MPGIVPTEEQGELQAAVRSMLDRRFPDERLRAAIASPDGRDVALWQSLTDLGLHALGVPESVGGAGGSPVELGLVVEEMGRALVSSPYFASTVLAAQAIATMGRSNDASAWIKRIHDGEITAALSLPPMARRSWEPVAEPLRAGRTDGQWRLDGSVSRVIDGATADIIVAVASNAGRRMPFLVETDQPAVRTDAVSTMDPTRRMATVYLAGARAVPLSDDQDRSVDLARVEDLALVMLAAEQLGGAGRCLSMAVSYAKTRFQHGQAIGSFQAIKHRCADMLSTIEAARSCTYTALSLAEDPNASLVEAASIAKVLASRAFTFAAESSVQIHGGIGFDWEHSAHLYLKRAKSSEILFGTPNSHRERVAECLAI